MHSINETPAHSLCRRPVHTCPKGADYFSFPVPANADSISRSFCWRSLAVGALPSLTSSSMLRSKFCSQGSQTVFLSSFICFVLCISNPFAANSAPQHAILSDLLQAVPASSPGNNLSAGKISLSLYKSDATHENRKINAPRRLHSRTIPGCELQRLFPHLPSGTDNGQPRRPDGRILDNETRLAATALQNPGPAGQALRPENRRRRRFRRIKVGHQERRKLPLYVRHRENTPRNSHRPRRQTPQSLVFGPYRRPLHQPEYPGPVSQQTRCRLLHPDPSVPQHRREILVPAGDAGARNFLLRIRNLNQSVSSWNQDSF